MKYLYDPASNTLALTFVEGRTYRDSDEIYDGVVVDYDSDGRPYAIEFLRVHEFVDTRGLVSGRPVKISGSELRSDQPVTGESLRSWRDQLGLSQRELATQLNVEQELLGAWEAGAVAIENPELLRLALQAVEGNVRERFFRNMLEALNESMKDYTMKEPLSSDFLRQGKERGA
jgi:DNA-binding transcriptional regulator YiaG/uncharacterized protein YuzE